MKPKEKNSSNLHDKYRFGIDQEVIDSIQKLEFEKKKCEPYSLKQSKLTQIQLPD